jgi:hypothetical protein
MIPGLVLDDLELRDRDGPVRRGEDHAFRIGDANGSPACVDLDGRVRHRTGRYPPGPTG